MSNIVTVTGIRPDFIRMSEVFKKFDERFGRNHTLVHSGQHYGELLSDVFFKNLQIRKPDANLGIGGTNVEHYQQTALLVQRLIEYLRNRMFVPAETVVVFLGDSNTVLAAPFLRKEGYKIVHIEAGMRSYDKRMLEETNRVMCDHSSDTLFVYHPDYADNLMRESIPVRDIYVVGNTIVEVCQPFTEHFRGNILTGPIFKREDYILLDIHRPENFKYPIRLLKILTLASELGTYYHMPVQMLAFGRTMAALQDIGIVKDGKLDFIGIETIPLMSYSDFLNKQYHAKFLISDSGTAQEEPALLNTPVIVPRDFTERPQSMQYSCSRMVQVESYEPWRERGRVISWLETAKALMDPSWLGTGDTAQYITDVIETRYA